MPDENTKAPYRMITGVGPDGTGMTVSDVFELVRDGTSLVRDGVPLHDEEAVYLIRCAGDGKPVIPVGAPMHVQLRALRDYDSVNEGGVDGHLADLAALRKALGDASDPAAHQDAMRDVRHEVHLYDATLAAPRDTVLPQRVVEAWTEAETARPPGVDPVLRRLQQDIGIDEEEWTRVLDLPQHRNEQMRAMAREMLRPILGNSAQLEDLRFIPMAADEVERANALRRWMRDSGEVREVPSFSHKAMPGYRTSGGMLAERDGVTMLVFTDFMGTYAYAWQTDPDVAPTIEAEADARPFPYNMMP